MTNQEYSSPVITLKEEDTIHDAIIKMHQNNIKRIVITSDDTRKDTPIAGLIQCQLVVASGKLIAFQYIGQDIQVSLRWQTAGLIRGHLPAHLAIQFPQ